MGGERDTVTDDTANCDTGTLPTGRRLAVGVDVGGTKVLAALVAFDHNGVEVLDRHQLPSEAGSPEVVDTLIAAATPLVDDRVEAIGLGLAGFIDLEGTVVKAPNAAGLVGRDVRGRFERAFGRPVTIDNDANCAAAAARALVAPDCDSLVCVTLGTGIGGGILIGGRLLRGAHGYAAEPGHTIVDPDGPECPCGQRGCWERYASGNGLAYLARTAIEAGDGSSLLAAAGGRIEAVRGEHVTRLAAAGDAEAEAVLERWCGWVALGLANLINLLDPEVLVIGGGLVGEGAGLLARIERRLSAFPAASATPGRVVHLTATPGGPEGGALGAAVLALAETCSEGASGGK